MFGNLFNSKDPKVPTPPQPAQGTTTAETTTKTTEMSIGGFGLPIIPIVPDEKIVQQTTQTTNNTNPVPQDGAAGGLIGSSMAPDKRQDLSALSHLDARCAKVLAHAQQEAGRLRQQFIEPEELLLGLLFDEDIFKLLEQFNVDGSKLLRELQSKTPTGTFSGQSTLSDASKQLFESAYKAAKDRGSSFITPEDLLLAVFDVSTPASSTLQAEGIKKDAVQEKLAKNPEFSEGGKKSVLEQFGVDLTQKAKNGELDPVAGRDKEVERIVHILLRRTKNNPIIIGEAGVGKTAVVEGLAEQIVAGTAPKDLLSKRIIQLDVSSLIAGASHRGEFEERLRNVIKEAMASSGTIILFFDEIHTLMGAGDTDGALDASNIIKPYLARGQLQIIGTTTTAEYRKYFEKDKAFERRFQPVLCDEPDEDTAVEMMKVLKAKYENFHKVVIPEDTLKAAVKLSKKYVGERYLPDKAVDLLDEAAADVRLRLTEGKTQDNTVKQSDIEQVVSAWTGIPITKLTEDESQKLLHLDALIHKRLIDQEEAVQAVAEAVRRGRIGLANANRPIASFIFLGPTGVGKTELAKTLAEILFGRDDAMVRLDMSEYMEKHEVAKLIGAPPGYVGYEEGGQLTEAVRAKPYSIVLLDEVEKAHPDVFNILLQLLEDGRLTDNKGNTISFKNTIVIATSNIGSQLIQDSLGKMTAKTTQEDFAKQFGELNTKLTDELRKFFRPELLNRFDEIVVFKPLRMEDMSGITKLGIGATAKLLHEQGFGLQITDKAIAELSKEGYDPVYGARPLRRLIQTAIENPIALEIISKKFIAGDSILIDYSDAQSKFLFTKATPPPVQAETNGQSVPPTQPGIPPVPGQSATLDGNTSSSPGQPATTPPTPQSGAITDPTDPVHSAYENMVKSYETQNGAAPTVDSAGILGQPQTPTPPPAPPTGGNDATMSVGSGTEQ